MSYLMTMWLKQLSLPKYFRGFGDSFNHPDFHERRGRKEPSSGTA